MGVKLLFEKSVAKNKTAQVQKKRDVREDFELAVKY